ncbi:MAG TPA: CoB--CoM heterodisulfide reductase iron-sulfur subunit A family protein [candidate division Zixibacteria bacterium]|nr:CoB--CoM heterodisulfide reductase iron-sulfur subunit A family protein [candidate division Zixibacteria bacterium]
MAEFEPDESQIRAETLVVGGGIAGMTVAIETAELGKHVILAEKLPSIGGRVAAMHQYFPKLCPPTCGIEINLKRIRQNPYIRVLTLAEIGKISGSPGDYEVEITLKPRYVNDKCTACGDCEKVCEIERDNEFNYGLDKSKAIYIPHLMAYPPRYVVDPEYASDERMKKCVEACKYDAIELDMQPKTVTAKVKAVVWATGWRPYDATKIDNLGFGRFKNVITNVIMERMASVNGPTSGKIIRPSDQKEITKIGFVQCAGSRDENHLPYCSAVCCLASMKHATYIRELYPDAEVHMFYIDVRSPGRLEDFYVKMQEDEKFHFHRGKVAKIEENPANQNLVLHAENTLTGQITTTEVDLAVLATGMVPNTADEAPPLETPLDDFGFIVPDTGKGVLGTGSAVRPMEVSASIQDATGTALKALNIGTRR